MCWSLQIKRFDPEFQFLHSGSLDSFNLTHPFNRTKPLHNSFLDMPVPDGTLYESLITAGDGVILHLNSYLKKSFNCCQPSVVHERWLTT
jgi:hypothetical protein